MRIRIAPSASTRFDAGRRRMLETGLAGSALLIAGRWLAPAAVADTASASKHAYLTGADVVILARIAPVVLAGALPSDAAQLKSAVAEIIDGIDMTIGFEPPAVRKEIRDLFDLLGSGVTRSLVAGIWQPWEKASSEDIQKFLTSWRNSRFDLLRSAYIGLTGLIIGSWYGNPRSWERIGYPGPPRIA
ncbi:MAG: hypothetical protein ACJ8NR_17295 [Sulfurifustis sp.]